MQLVDTHVHLYLDRFDADRDDVVARARAAGVTRFVLPAIDVPSVHAALALSDRYAGCFAMAALHPSETATAPAGVLDTLDALCTDPRVVAVGESGLDYYWDRSFDAVQERFLRAHVQLALRHDLPLVLHSRDRAGGEEVYPVLLRVLREEQAAAGTAGRRLRGIFHCFTGTPAVAEDVVALGFLLGIGGVLTFKNGGLEPVVQATGLGPLVLETDAPFLAPAPHRGKRNEPAYVRLVAERLAGVCGLPLEEVAATTTANALRLFGLS